MGFDGAASLTSKTGHGDMKKKGCPFSDSIMKNPGLTWKSYDKPWFSNLEKLRIAMEKSMAFLISHETMAGNRPSALSVEPLQAGHAPFWRAELQPAK